MASHVVCDLIRGSLVVGVMGDPFLGGGFKNMLFSPLFGEMIHFG